jgi:hypothetical protein
MFSDIMNEEKKEINKLDIDKRLKDLTEGITKEVQEEKRIKGTDLISDNRILEIAKTTFEGKMKVSLDNIEDFYKEQISKLKKEINKYKPKRSNVEFVANWDEGIDKIDLRFYTISTKSSNPRDECVICNAFEEHGFLTDLMNFWKEINVSKRKYKIKIWNVDQADRYLSRKTNEDYTERLTPEGMNWYYVKGLGIVKFPAYDLYIRFKTGKINKIPLHNRIQGIGKKNGEVYLFGVIESLINFFKDNFESSHLEETSFRHRTGDLYGDYKIDPKLKK